MNLTRPEEREHWTVICPELKLKLFEAKYFGKSAGLFWKRADGVFTPANLKIDDATLDFDTDWTEVSQILLQYNDFTALSKKRTFKKISGQIVPTTFLGLRKYVDLRSDFTEFEAINCKQLLELEDILGGQIIKVEKYSPSLEDRIWGLIPSLFWAAVLLALIFLFARK